ncbi:hypothetical protein [Deinococcus multiflagellatus]|uniref:hypothetical protein n=1 Tax=Deinococcus multiflagellatus TaxID=1656887 RepID=UPI001CC92ABC|nr:hypothetical protein [Deinococcus multiflagellatus]MBZ9715342.1 hypothetical protein [Deinococcus multiflagellatus]
MTALDSTCDVHLRTNVDAHTARVHLSLDYTLTFPVPLAGGDQGAALARLSQISPAAAIVPVLNGALMGYQNDPATPEIGSFWIHERYGLAAVDMVSHLASGGEPVVLVVFIGEGPRPRDSLVYPLAEFRARFTEEEGTRGRTRPARAGEGAP